VDIHSAIARARALIKGSPEAADNLILTSAWDANEEFGLMFEEAGVLTCCDINGLSVARPLLMVNKRTGTVRSEWTGPAAPANGYRRLTVAETTPL
jgi:hypothetical protein